MNFSITSKMTKPEYIKVMYIGLYKKPSFIISTVFGLCLLTIVFLDYLTITKFLDGQPFYYIICGVFLVFSPTLIVMMAVNQLKSNPSFLNEITYTFNEEKILVEGITFKSELTWAHILKQKEIGGFLILYHTKKFGNFIDKAKLLPEQLLFIKEKVLSK